MTTPKDFGHNKWVYLNNEGLAYSSTYLRALQDGVIVGSRRLFKKNFFENFSNFLNSGYAYNTTTPHTISSPKPEFFNQTVLTLKPLEELAEVGFGRGHLPINPRNSRSRVNYTTVFTTFPLLHSTRNTLPYISFRQPSTRANITSLAYKPWGSANGYTSMSRFGTVDNRTSRFIYNKAPALRLLRNTFEKYPHTLFQVEQHESVGRTRVKYTRDQAYLVIKQKRYVAKKFRYTEVPSSFIAGLGLVNNGMDIRAQRYTHSHQRRYESTLASPMHKRLLRTRRMLVLPAHVNLAVITNSFDVVHSWYIPGLGFKLDCVPGRSTHHSLYIDHCGFYYGQCAEICGRYHHHMPIRVCALPFEHFML